MGTEPSDVPIEATPVGLPAHMLEHLRQASCNLREAERFTYRALHHGYAHDLPAAIANAKAALDHLLSVR